jgi:hypothetical protein
VQVEFGAARRAEVAAVAQPDQSAQKPEQDALETVAELVAERDVDERVDAAVDKTSEVREEHGEEEVGAAEEALRLQLADDVHQVERRPRKQESNGDGYHHFGHLQENSANVEKLTTTIINQGAYYVSCVIA